MTPTPGEKVHALIGRLQKNVSFVYANTPEVVIRIYITHAKSNLLAVGVIEAYTMDGDYFYQTTKSKYYGHHAQKAHLIGELLNAAQQSQHLRKSIPSFPVYERGLGNDLDTLKDNGFFVVSM